MNRRALLVTGVLVAGLLLGWWAFASGTVSAQTATTFSVESIGSRIGLGSADLRQVIINLIRILLGLVTLVAVAYLIYGGYLWLTAGGNEQRVEKAKEVILQALIGLVIILLAWAIVFFVVRTFQRVTTSSNSDRGGGCVGFGCLGSGERTFDLTGVTTCAVRPDYDTNVPRSSAAALYFNHDLDIDTVRAAVEDDLADGDPNLVILECSDVRGDGVGDDICEDGEFSLPAGSKISPQVFSGDRPTGAAGDTKAEWVAKGKAITFYHRSFSEDEASPDNRWFATNTTYRLIVPARDAPTAIKDTTDPGRTLQKCQRNSAGEPIEGDAVPGENCKVDETNNLIYWTFSVGTDVSGPALEASSTLPSSTYLTGVGKPDRNVDRERYPFKVEFNNAIDTNLVTNDNIQLFKFTTAPDPDDGTGGTVDPTPLPSSDYTVEPFGTGAWLQLKDGVRLEPFTWYKIVAKDFYSLCGTKQATPYEWVFETNDVVAGIKFVYPLAGTICPASEVFVKFATSMWKIGEPDCEPGGGSLVRDGTLSPNPGRGFRVLDPLDSEHPERSCTKYGFVPETLLLSPETPHTATVNTDLVIDREGTKLSRTWSFTTGTAESCVQPPYIDRLDPSSGQTGACVSVVGNYFEKKPPGAAVRESDGQNPGDIVQLEGTDQPVLGWQNNVIVSEVTTPDPPFDAGEFDKTHPYKVTVKYDDPIGPLESNEENLFLQAGDGSDGVCLLSVTPNSGPPESYTTLGGKRFGSYDPGNSAVLFSPAPPPKLGNVSAATWSEEQIRNAQIPATTPAPLSALLTVRRGDGAVSNALPYSVTAPAGPGDTTPRVAEEASCDLEGGILPSPSPRRSDVDVCLNSDVTARFTVDMNTTTFTTGNIYLEKCDPGCSLHPTGGLSASTNYQASITTGVKSATDIPLAGPYVWQFTTKADGAPCPIASVVINSSVAFGTAVAASPISYTFRETPYGVNMSAQPLDAECRLLDAGSLTYAWDTNNSDAAELSGRSGRSVLAFNPADPVAGGSTDTTVATEGKTSRAVRILYDPTSCRSSDDCRTNRFGEACPGSTCEDNRCTPVVNGLDPTAGPIGTWTTVKGCWFGGYDGAKSKVIFLGAAGDADDREGIAPDSDICLSPAATWTNERIVREVPNRSTPDGGDDAVSGPVRVNRFDDRQADGPDFTVNSDALTPGLCRLNPTRGPILTGVTASGARFGDDEPAKRTDHDQANIIHLGSGSLAIMSTYASWEDTKIGTQIPTDAAVGPSEVRVKNEDVGSNPWPFEVSDPGALSCTTKRCAIDDHCAPEYSTEDYGCARDFCCRPRPTISGTSPADGATGICRNTRLEVTFDQPIDEASVTGETVQYLDKGRVVFGSSRVLNDGSSGRLLYSPGILSPSALQTFHLTTRSTTTVLAFGNPSFEEADVNGVPTIWGNRNGKQSRDVPPDHTGFSGFADCSGCPAGDQSWEAQTIDGTEDFDVLYRVTGWVKVEGSTPGKKNGLIVVCHDFNNCGFDLVDAAPGVFSGPSGGWKFIEVVVAKTNRAFPASKLHIDCYAWWGAKTWCDDIKVEKITYGGDTLIRGTNGVRANVTTSAITSPITYTTGDSICRVADIQVSPNFWRFSAQDEVHFFWAGALSERGEGVSNVPGVYAWKWGWKSSNEGVASASMAGPDDRNFTFANVTARANGATTIQACANVTEDSVGSDEGKKICGDADAIVDFCENPWAYVDADQSGFTDAVGNCDSRAPCPDYHFTMSYCRGKSGGPLLPDFIYTGSNGRLGVIEGQNAADPNRVKSMFFKESATSRDVIGLLIYRNPDLLPPYEWFRQRFPLDSGGSSTTIGGYPAFRTGTTAYIGVTDITDGGPLEGFIFVIDYNSNAAAPETKNIFNQMINSVVFNTNLPGAGWRPILRDDTRRVQDLAAIKAALKDYHEENDEYPKLTAGSFLIGMSTSRWPSWQQTLGNALGRALPEDPANVFIPECKPPEVSVDDRYEADSCWSELRKAFQCPSGSTIYAYQSDGRTYTLYANMQYTRPGNFINAPGSNPCSGIPGSNCSCFNYALRP
ncbi:MAG: Ig-like domain-containing protein [Candidatus Kerfeldbacteria bacterium]|nr:Ig-like domain-containing protein [Candidatus Kerfeldbacteria bacterium]